MTRKAPWFFFQDFKAFCFSGLSVSDTYAKNNFFSVIFFNHCSSQAGLHSLSTHQQPVFMYKNAILFNLTQHIFFGENSQVSIHIFRVDCFWGVKPDIGKEIFSLFCQTEVFKLSGRIVLDIMIRIRLDRIKHDIICRQSDRLRGNKLALKLKQMIQKNEFNL